MGKLFLLLLVIGLTSVFGSETEALEGMRGSSGFAGGVLGIGIIHGMFFVPIVAFILAGGIIPGFYFKMFKQKDDGLFKAVGSIFIGIVIGITAYIFTLKMIDGAFESDNCGQNFIKAYMKDTINLGIKDGAKFGDKISEVECLK